MKQYIQYTQSKIIILIIILLLPININAITKDKVEIFKCVDGDTARFVMNKKEIKVRFLGIDSPEIEKNGVPAEEYGEEAKNYTCRKLKQANKIELVYEDNSDKTDKYDRVLAYVFVDDKLLEELIVKNGYAKVKYINKNYKYYDTLISAENYAIEKKKGMYSENRKITSDEDIIKKIKKYIIKYSKKVFSNILREILN